MATVDYLDALTSDSRVLLATFEQMESVRFETFCEVWKQLKFSLIHHAGDHEWQKYQVVECLYRILCRYLIPSCPLQYQVGAIYSLYSIYHTQHVTPKVKIRMTLSMWNDLMNLQEYVKEQKHHDVYYIISSLRADKAFLFVAMPIQLALGSRDAISLYEREIAKESKSSNAVKNAEEIIQKLSEIDDLYNATKIKVCSPDKESMINVDPVTLRVASSDFVSNLQQDVKNFEMWRKTGKDNSDVKHLQPRPQLGLPEDRVNHSDKQRENEKTDKLGTRSQVVNEIKERSFKTITQVSRSKRRYQPIPESAKSSERVTRKRTPTKKK